GGPEPRGRPPGRGGAAGVRGRRGGCRRPADRGAPASGGSALGRRPVALPAGVRRGDGGRAGVREGGGAARARGGGGGGVSGPAYAAQPLFPSATRSSVRGGGPATAGSASRCAVARRGGSRRSAIF